LVFGIEIQGFKISPNQKLRIMKTLDLKKLKLLYVNLIAIVVLLPFFGGFYDGLYAQPVILQDTWHLIEGDINGSTIPQQVHHIAEFEHSISGGDIFDFTFGNCFEFFSVPYVDLTNDEFSLLNIDTYTTGSCTEPGDLAFIDLHNSFYFNLPLDTNGSPKNPFTYNVADFVYYRELTIINPQGDWLLYRGIMLSTQSFNKDSFTIHPNPVKESLEVNNTSNQEVTASVYDINGKQLQSHYLEYNLSKIDVKALNSGLYFVVFESETGERVSKKFVKQ
jgi:hypothetical protein